ILERLYTIESEILQIDEAIAIQGNNDIEPSAVEDHQAKPLLLGVKFLDPLVGLVVSGMILKAGLQTGYQRAFNFTFSTHYNGLARKCEGNRLLKQYSFLGAKWC
ncbi:unnamed protein product, partial [Ilex paraguariensis]